MTKARTLADMISDGVIGTTELADDVITPVKLDETGSYSMAQLNVSAASPNIDVTDTGTSHASQDFLTNSNAVRATIGVERSAGGGLFVGSSAYAAVFGTASSGNTQFATNNNVRMTISSSGNVGIGTNNPDNNSGYTALTLSNTTGSGGGQVYVKASSAVGVFGADNAGSGTNAKVILQTNTNHPLVFSTNGSEAMRIKSDGTTQLNGQLDFVDSGSKIVRPTANGLGVNVGSIEAVRFTSSGGAIFNNTENINQNFTVKASGNSNALFVDGNGGNVGIGPGSLDALQSRSSFNYKSLRVQNFNINAGDSNYGFIGQNLYQDTAGQTKYIDNGYSSSIHFWGDQMQFHIGTGLADASHSNTEKMRMLSNGNIQQFKQMHFGYTYYTNNGYVDTDFTAADGMVFEIAGSVNPNSGGSSYSDVFHGHIYIGKGWNGSALTHYVYFVLDTPPARDIYPSGSSASGNEIDVVIHNNGTETTNVSQADSSNWNIRIKAFNYNSGSGSNFYLNITRKL